jgi:hypothetical protein
MMHGRNVLNQETLKPRNLGETLGRLGKYFGSFWYMIVLAVFFVVISTWTQVTSRIARTSHGLFPRARGKQRLRSTHPADCFCSTDSFLLLAGDDRRPLHAFLFASDHLRRLSPRRIHNASTPPPPPTPSALKACSV